MLLSLRIENIALMDMLEIRFQKGLHVLTGETGAGKSIIVDAVVLLLGGKAQKELIRTGAQKARVEGVFDIGDCPAAGAFLREQELDEGGEVQEQLEYYGKALETFPSAQIITIEGADHYFQGEPGQKMIEATLDFVKTR